MRTHNVDGAEKVVEAHLLTATKESFQVNGA